MAWQSKVSATQLTNITSEQFFNQVITLNPGEMAHIAVSADFPTTPTDDLIVAVYSTLDDSSETWSIQPVMEFTIENSPDPNRTAFLLSGFYKCRIGVRRSGTTDTIASADMSFRKDGVSA